MRNIVKFDTNTEPLDNSIKIGKYFQSGVNNAPTQFMEMYYNGITPINGGYTIYIKRGKKGPPTIYSPKNDEELIDIASSLFGENFESANMVLEFLFKISMDNQNIVVFNHNYQSIVTESLILNYDFSFVSSYPRTGETVRDISRNEFNGFLINSPEFRSINGGSLRFDGTNDYVYIPKNVGIILNSEVEASMCIWVKLNNQSNGVGDTGIIQLSGAKDTNGNLYFYSNGYTYLDIFRTDRHRVFNNNSVVATDWHMLTVTTTPGTNGWKCYINDKLMYQTEGQDKVYVDPEIHGGLSLGENSGGRYTYGEISDCQIYTKALSEDEVLQNYYAGLQRLVTTEGLALSLNPQNTNLYAPQASQPRLSPIANDISGNDNNGTLVNEVQITSESGGSWDFDGSDDKITIPFNGESMDFSRGQTICMWLRPHTGAPLSRRNPYNQAYGGSGTITHERGGNFSYYFGTNGGNSSPYVGRGSSFKVDENELSFITVTRNQETNVTNWYKNGYLTNTANAGGYEETKNSTSDITIGDGYAGNFLGDIFDVKVYNRGLTDEEVLIIYESTKLKYE